MFIVRSLNYSLKNYRLNRLLKTKHFCKKKKKFMIKSKIKSYRLYKQKKNYKNQKIFSKIIKIYRLKKRKKL